MDGCPPHVAQTPPSVHEHLERAAWTRKQPAGALGRQWQQPRTALLEAQTMAPQPRAQQQQEGVGGGYHEYYYDDATDAYWLCFIRHNLYSMHHYTGTCRMGDKSDVTTVVTPDLRWVGVDSCILSQMKV